MTVTREEIKTLARLAKLDFDDERCAAFEGEFEEIIEFANAINCEIAGDNASISEVGGREIALDDLREDEVGESLPNEKIVSNVEAQDGYFPVRRVVR